MDDIDVDDWYNAPGRDGEPMPGGEALPAAGEIVAQQGAGWRYRIAHKRTAKAWSHETTVELHGAGDSEEIDAAALYRMKGIMEHVGEIAQAETDRRNRRDFGG